MVFEEFFQRLCIRDPPLQGQAQMQANSLTTTTWLVTHVTTALKRGGFFRGLPVASHVLGFGAKVAHYQVSGEGCGGKTWRENSRLVVNGAI